MLGTKRVGLLVSFALLVSANLQAGQVLYGITADNNLITINTTTGVGTVVGPIVLGESQIAIAAAGLASYNSSLYAYDSNNEVLRQIDPSTAKVLATVNLGITSIIGEGNVTFGADGTGYIASTLTGAGTFGSGSLWTFTTSASSGGLVNASGFGTYDGLAFGGTSLYALSQGGSTLYTINTTNGTSTAVGTGTGLTTTDAITGFPLYGFGALAFGPSDNVLYAVLADFDGVSNLYTLNTTTGVATMVGAIGVANVDGIAFLPPALTSIAVTPASPSIAKGLTQQFTATGTYTDGSTQNISAGVTWASATTSVATISSAGLATAVGTGTSNITANLSGITSPVDTLTVTVASLVSIAVTPASPSIAKGLTQQFTATGTYTDGSTQNISAGVTWASATTSVATIGSGGLATAVGTGTSNITASLSGITSPVDTLTVTVPSLVSIAVTPASPSIAKGLTQQFTATGTYTDGSTQNISAGVTWASATTSVATISSAGLATAVGTGTSNITANLSGITSPVDTLTVTVPSLVSIAVTPASPSILKGLTQQFTATGTYTDASTQNISASVTWTSATSSVATIASGGLATGVGTGTSNITASLSGVTSPADTLTVATNFVTGYALNNPALRNDFGSYAGMELTVGTKQLTVYSVGRICVNGNSQTHIVKLVNQSTMMDDPGGSASVNMTSCTAGQFVYQNLTAPITLSPGSSHFLVSQEFVSGDQWYDAGTITTMADASVVGSAFLNGSSWVVGATPNVAFVPPSMIYATAPTPPGMPAFVINYNQNNQPLRNDFTGFVGMSLTTGPAALNVSSVGRVCVAGNTQSHVVKFVYPGTGADVPGGSTTVNMTGCTPGTFVYGSLASGPLALQTSTAYYLVSQETAGGDQWYDQSTLITTHDAAVNSSVYSNGGSWNTNALNTSYVPPNFQYSLVGTPPGAVTITVGTNIPGPSFTVDTVTYSTPQTFTWVSGSMHSISTTTPQSAGTGSQYAFSAWSDSGSISHSVTPTSNTTYTATFTQQYLLTTHVTGSGSIFANPTSGSGYYNSGTSVSLMANPTAGNVFFNWTGDLSDSANPQSITMSAPHSVTANFQPMSAATGFVTGFALSSPPQRNNFTGFVGMSLTVGGSPLNVSTVGRACVTGNSLTHTVKFVNAATGTDVTGGSASVNMASCIGGTFVYANLASPITLTAGTSYYLVSQETTGGDMWYDNGTLTTKPDATETGAVYSSGASYIAVAGSNSSYVPPSFQYSALAPVPQPFVLTYNLNGRPLRNDFNGFVGLAFTVGSNPISVSSVGRVCVSGNSGTHTVELVNAVTGVVVPDSSASVSMTGCTPAGFQYTALGSAITLPAGGTYYLVSGETAGGDQWYDLASLTSASAGQVTNSAYQNNGAWITTGGTNTSYVPVNLQYTIAP